MKNRKILATVFFGVAAFTGAGTFADTGTVTSYHGPISGTIKADVGPDESIEFYSKDMLTPVKKGDRVSYRLFWQPTATRGQVIYRADQVQPIVDKPAKK